MKSLTEILVNKKTESPIEELLYQELINLGIKPVCQFEVGFFRLDLAYPEIKLAIEADGKDCHSTPSQKSRDKYRQEKLEKLGWKFERFSGTKIKKNGKSIAGKIAIKYFNYKLTKENKEKATGAIIQFLATRDKDLTVRLIDTYMGNF